MKSSLTRDYLRLAVLTGIALLFAQLGAISHAYSHGAAKSATTHHSSAKSHDSCDDCLAYAPLLAAAGMPLGLPPIEAPGTAARVNDTSTSSLELTLSLAFRSRAPPSRT